MRFIKTILLTFFVFISVFDIYAGEADGLFVKGGEYYQKGNYDAAIAEYQKIIAAGYESWEVYYNLGNAYFKDRQIGRAILNYERARKLNPENEDIQYNLELANLSTADRIQELPDFFLMTWLRNFAQLFDFGVLGGVTFFLYVLVVALLIARLFLKSHMRKSLLLSTVIAASSLLFFASILGYRIYQNETTTEAIVVTDKVEVKSAPDENSTDVFTLHEGVKLTVQDRSLSWVKIRLADGKVGWLREEIIEKI